MTQPKLQELTIDSTAYGGKGVARCDGKVYFVEDAIEGDVVQAEILEDNGRYATAIARELKTPSTFRNPSPCAYSDHCGGCQWQGVPYSKQLAWKHNFVISALQRIGKFSDISCNILASPTDLLYRNRILLRGRLLPDGSIVVGYFRRGSREFIGIDKCMIADTRLNDFISRVTKLKVAPAPAKEIKFRFEIQILPDSSNENHILLSVYDPDDKGMSAQDLAKKLHAAGGVLWSGAVRQLADAPFFPFEEDLGIKFHTSAGMFQQVNVSHNHTMRRMVKEAVEHLKPSSILDIFCGSGNLSLPLADGIRQIKGVEFSKRAIECAAYNCKENQLKNAEYFSGDTEKFLWRASKAGESYDLVIADPPREGMYKALVPLMNMAPKHIIYVSCDPTTLARDLALLCKNDYQIVSMTALDFFPNTYHIETFVVLSRNKKDL